ncbi:programmed cell death 1 ligand 1-like isoform X2 [Colossoma macropomum]|nr:programmed cell death 1 ligand 1-like isoform X2 [Colossoma macropomum]XP_036416195.1 programmed cell death 1 ligand 1-like isoform X2 [Colossoma macropomum]XP_036416196.1 programmed cell death 1 ligand 1-like isoform X2 [Colossoma macropomum]XP_036416197.1 programmed cell death 1 ligand 1-like isoform X2 [Colossoma macropomum]
MNTFLLILLLACCAGSLSAQSRIYLSVKAASSAVLPCDWRNKTQSPGERPHIEWRTMSETVFERLGGEQYEGEGYERRVDVPEDKLLSGDCSLMLKDVRLTDAGPYESYLLQKQTKRSLNSKRVFIQGVELSVEDASEETAAAQSVEEFSLVKLSASSGAGMIHSLSAIIMFIILANILFCII